MARLNTQLSATPLPRASTVDSLYRDPSVAPEHSENARTSSYSVLSPSRSSDKENDQPETRDSTPRRGKSGGLRGASARMPTPDSGSTTGNGNKRRRTDNYSLAPLQVYEDGQDDQDDRDDEHVETSSQTQHGQGEEGDLKFYNPNQDPEQRRRLRASMRNHQRMLDDNRNGFIRARNSGLLDAIKTQNSLYGKVRQTADATVDSRFLVNASDLARKKLNNSLGNSGAGVDLDQFVSKCIYFMKSGGYVAGEEDAPVVPVNEDDDNEDPDGLNWALLGRQACFPCNKRPPTSSFLLGPLSVQKRVRTTQRKARSQRQPLGPATRPQEIREGDIQQNESGNLTNLVKGIRKILVEHVGQGQDSVEEELCDIPEEELSEEDTMAALRRHRMAMTKQNESAVNLLDFAINPGDFGQTVENLFYISFLVREGNAKIVKEADGLPLLLPAEPRGVSEQREDNVQKHQAVFSLDYPAWLKFIEALDIRTPLIPHREAEETNIGSNGWYNA